MKNILFLCTGNSCRSQIAEGWGKSLLGTSYRFHSAGTHAHGLNPRAVQVMAEVGIDISQHRSKTIAEFRNEPLDVVFTVCSDADQTCPTFPGSRIIHVGFDDPPGLTKKLTDEESVLQEYRRVRDQIKNFVVNIEKYIED